MAGPTGGIPLTEGSTNRNHRAALNVRRWDLKPMWLQTPGVILMEYRGVEFTVLQSASPRGWRWTVEIAGRKPKSAIAHNRTGAILDAQRAIDAALGIQPVNAPSEPIQ